MEKVYVIGHMNPDTDSIVSALCMAHFLNARDTTKRYFSVMAGKPNPETELVFEKFGLELPELLENAEGKKLFLVDHNESSQILKGWKPENIVGFVDHHKIKFECPFPIEVHAMPWGSTSTIIYDLFIKEGIDIPSSLKKAMLCAILSDTVILKSPTTTLKDIKAVESLSSELDIDFQQLGLELFKAKARVAEKTPAEILKNDFKDFDFGGKKVGIGQLEVPDMNDVLPKAKELVKEMHQLRKEGKYHTIILMLTDIIQEGSRLLIVSEDEEGIAQIFNARLENNLSEFMPGIMSRKKQVAAALAERM